MLGALKGTPLDFRLTSSSVLSFSMIASSDLGRICIPRPFICSPEPGVDILVDAPYDQSMKCQVSWARQFLLCFCGSFGDSGGTDTF